MKIIKERTLNEELHVYTAKELLSNSFVTKFVQAYKDKIIDVITTTGYALPRSTEETLNDVPTKISEKGVYDMRRLVHSFISIKLNMGANIANQSVDNLKTSSVWLEFINKVHSKLNWKQAELASNFTLMSVEDWWRKNR